MPITTCSAKFVMFLSQISFFIFQMMHHVSIINDEKSLSDPFGSVFSISYRSKADGIEKIARMRPGVSENHFIALFDEDDVDVSIEMKNASEDRFVCFSSKAFASAVAFTTIANSSWKTTDILKFRTNSNMKFDVNVEYSQPPYYNIYVNIGKSRKETLEVNRLLTVADLKKVIKRKFDIDRRYQMFYLDGKELGNELTMENLGIKEYSTLDLKGVVVPITVKLIPNKPLPIEIDSLDTVGDIKMKIKEKEGIPVHEQHLYDRYNEMNDAEFLKTDFSTTLTMFLTTKWKNDLLEKPQHECSPQSSFRVKVRHNGNVFAVDTCSFETVEELMNKIQKKEYTQADGLDKPKSVLFLQSRRLQNDLTLEMYGIKDGSQIVAHVPCTQDHHICIGQQIIMKNLSGKSYSIPFCGLKTIETVKRRMSQETGIPFDQQGLVFGGMLLQNELTLNHYGVYPDATLHLIMRLRAGCGCGCNCGGYYDCKRFIVWKNRKDTLKNFSELPSHNFCIDRSIQIKPFVVELRLASMSLLS